MGVVILSSAVSDDPAIKSSVVHGGNAGKSALARAGVAPRDVNLMINVGVYRDNNMVEPAMAAMIQKEIGISLDYAKSEHEAPAFSFDLMNGAVGLLSAVKVASAFLATGGAQRILVVASDAHPSQRDVDEFPFATMGAALLLGFEPYGDRGFGRVDIRTDLEGQLGLEGYISYGSMTRDGITVEEDPDFVPRALVMAERHVLEYAQSEKVDLSESLLVTSHLSPTFATELAGRLGLSHESVVAPVLGQRLPHSSALAWGVHEAHARGQLSKFKSVLFLAAGSGISTACAVYRTW